MERNLLENSVKSASFSILSQVLFRIATFLLNAFIIRQVGQVVLGIINVRLLLLESTILFLTTEPIQKSCQLPNNPENWVRIVNQVWLSLPISAIVSVICIFIWTSVLSKVDTEFLSEYTFACYAIGVSCFVEQFLQIFLILAQNYGFIRLKILFDSIHFTSRSLIFISLILHNSQSVINAFSIAQISSIFILFFSNVIFFSWYIYYLQLIRKEKKPIQNIFRNMNDFHFDSMKHFLPKFQSVYFDRNLFLLTFGFWKQSFFKQILTEGEKYVMTISPIFSFQDQSTYDIVNNLGSLFARFVFRPIETNAYYYFTQLIDRHQPISVQNSQKIHQSITIFRNICKFVFSIALIIFVFGQSFSESLLWLYAGDKLTNSLAINLLKLHCFLTIFLAINGITECFCFATMNTQQLDHSNHLMVILSVIFLVLSYIFVNYFGPVGLILANCSNMFLRVVHSLFYISKKFSNSSLNGFLINVDFLVILILCGILCKFSERKLYENYLPLHIFVGCLLFSITILFWCKCNLYFLKMCLNKSNNVDILFNKNL